MPCADGILSGFLDGMTFKDEDTILFVDVVPNRSGSRSHFEFVSPRGTVQLKSWGVCVHYVVESRQTTRV